MQTSTALLFEHSLNHPKVGDVHIHTAHVKGERVKVRDDLRKKKNLEEFISGVWRELWHLQALAFDSKPALIFGLLRFALHMDSYWSWFTKVILTAKRSAKNTREKKKKKTPPDSRHLHQIASTGNPRRWLPQWARGTNTAGAVAGRAPRVSGHSLWAAPPRSATKELPSTTKADRPGPAVTPTSKPLHFVDASEREVGKWIDKLEDKRANADLMRYYGAKKAYKKTKRKERGKTCLPLCRPQYVFYQHP